MRADPMISGATPPLTPRSEVPVEIVSKVILRHTNLSTTQRYFGKVTDTEAIWWIDNLYR